MKRKILYAGLLSVLMLFSCKDWLDSDSNSSFTDDFIYATEESIFKQLLNAYTLTMTGQCLSDRITMYLNGPGSDVELRPDYASTGRGEIINCYPNEVTQFIGAIGTEQWTSGYKAINAANEVIKGIKDNYPDVLKSSEPTNLSQMYGEAVVLRALIYYELIRNFGDVVFITEPAVAGMNFGMTTTQRWEIMDILLDELEEVAPKMLWWDNISQKSERVSRGFAYGLIAKMALQRGGYALHPNGTGRDDWGEVKRDEANWRTAYLRAEAALRKLVGSNRHSLITTDERTNVPGGRNGEFDNPFQRVFQYQMDYEITAESLWECALAVEYGGNWGYAYSRAHTGASNTNVSKAYGAIRFTPTYYYMFDPADLRRDITVAVTGTSGNGIESPYDPAMFGDGGFNGLPLNKWDKMRMAKPYNQASGKAGINFVYMRYADALLLYAETLYMLGDEGGAKSYLKEVRSRAFKADDQAEKVDDYVDRLSGDALYTAIKEERLWELGGENQRKHDLIRWGDFNKAIIDARAMLRNQADQIASRGFYEFPNGLHIPDSIYVKQCSDADMVNMGLDTYTGTTYGTPEGQEDNPILFPGWRGVGDASKFPTPNANLAIKGLTRYLIPAERETLRKEGYTAAPWGIQLVGPGGTGYSEYIELNWSGYPDSKYAEGKSARNICPIPGQTIIDAGVNPETGQNYLRNYYGFTNE